MLNLLVCLIIESFPQKGNRFQVKCTHGNRPLSGCDEILRQQSGRVFGPGCDRGGVARKNRGEYPSVKFHLLDSEGNLRKHFNVFVNGTHVRDLNGLDTPLQEQDKVILMASAAGG
jgi:molybdopterin converting factor small subunit